MANEAFAATPPTTQHEDPTEEFLPVPGSGIEAFIAGQNLTLAIDVGEATAEGLEPLGPTRLAEITTVRPALTYDLLGHVTHVVIGPGGDVDYPNILDWESNEEAPGGYGPASGKISAAALARKPEVYVQRAKWISSHVESGEVVWAGELAEKPIARAAFVDLVGKGISEIYGEREVDRIHLQSHGTLPWVVGMGEPMITGNPSPIEGEQSVNFGKGNMAWGGDLGDPLPPAMVHIPNGDLSRVEFDVDYGDEFSPGIIGFRVHALGDPPHDSSVYRQDPHSGGGNDGLVHSENLESPNYNNQTDWFGQTSKHFDVRLDGPTIEGIRHSPVSSVILGPAPTVQHNGSFVFVGSASVRNMKLYGIARTARFTSGDLVRHICSLLRIRENFVDTGGPNILPYDTEQAVAVSEPLDYASLVSGWRHFFGFAGGKVALDFRPYSDKVWTMLDGRSDFVPKALERFDRLQIPYTDNADNSHYVTVRADPDLLERHNSYGKIEMQNTLPDEDSAAEFGAELMPYLQSQRYAGESDLGFVIDEDGTPKSAHLVHAGDQLRNAATGKGMNIKTIHRTQRRVTVTLDEDLHALNRMIARRQLHLKPAKSAA